MPTISMFYGILVTLFYEDNDRHLYPTSMFVVKVSRHP
jgi:hypothetical protein